MKIALPITLLLALGLNVLNATNGEGASLTNRRTTSLRLNAPTLDNTGARSPSIGSLKKPKKILKNSASINSHIGNGSETLNLVKRREWKARPTPNARRYAKPPSKIIIHHTASKNCTDKITCVTLLQEIQQYRIDVKGLDSIGYNFVIGGDGRVYEGLGWNLFTNVTQTKHDPNSLHVAFMGDFTSSVPNDAQIRAYKKLQQYGDNKYYIKSYRLHGHRDIACTSCPGQALYNVIRVMPRYQRLNENTCRNSTLTSAMCI